MIGAQRARAARARYGCPGLRFPAPRGNSGNPRPGDGPALPPTVRRCSLRLLPGIAGKKNAEPAGTFGISRGLLLGVCALPRPGGICWKREALETMWNWEEFRNAPGASGREAALLRHGEGGGGMWRVDVEIFPGPAPG